MTRWLLIGLTGVIVVVYLLQEYGPRFNLTPRGGSLDSLRQRWNVLGLILRSMKPGHRMVFTVGPRRQWRGWWPWGYGPRTMERMIIRWASAYGIEKLPLGHAHLDVGQYLSEYGLPGVASLILLGWHVVPHLRWHDPWSACFVAGCVLSLGTINFRVVTTGLIWFVAAAKLAGGI